VFGKVAVLIVSTGLCACALLAARQMRTQAAYELSQARLRAIRIDEGVARVRAVISARVNPERVLEMAARVNPMKPLAVNRPGSTPPNEPPRVASNQSSDRRSR
jgi:hypothetical protein